MGYPTELAKWIKAGRPVRPLELIVHLFDNVCGQCKYFQRVDENRARCKWCWCWLKRYTGSKFNKLEWGTTRCPLREPKWVEYEGALEFAEPPTGPERKENCCR